MAAKALRSKVVSWDHADRECDNGFPSQAVIFNSLALKDEMILPPCEVSRGRQMASGLRGFTPIYVSDGICSWGSSYPARSDKAFV